MAQAGETDIINKQGHVSTKQLLHALYTMQRRYLTRRKQRV